MHGPHFGQTQKSGLKAKEKRHDLLHCRKNHRESGLQRGIRAGGAGNRAGLIPGAVILNPAVLPEGLSNEGYMRICFAMLDVAETVVFLPGSEKSDGAKLEEAYCRYTGKRTTTLLHMVLKKRLEEKSNGK